MVIYSGTLALTSKMRAVSFGEEVGGDDVGHTFVCTRIDVHGGDTLNKTSFNNTAFLSHFLAHNYKKIKGSCPCLLADLLGREDSFRKKRWYIMELCRSGEDRDQVCDQFNTILNQGMNQSAFST